MELGKKRLTSDNLWRNPLVKNKIINCSPMMKDHPYTHLEISKLLSMKLGSSCQSNSIKITMI
jgi:hypothetical protein